MVGKTLFRVVVGVVLIVSIITIAQYFRAFRAISDEEIDEKLLRTSILFNAQYQQIRAHFPEETFEIREEAKRLEKMRRRGIGVPAGAMLHVMLRVMTPKFRAMHNAPEDMLDTSLALVLQSYSVLNDSPNCGPFLLNGTVSITFDERQRLWASQAADTPQHFDAILAGLSNPIEHPEATRESWGAFYSLYLQQGHPETDIDLFLLAFGTEPNHDLVDREALCPVFIGMGQALVDARFPGSAALKSGLILPSFGISAR